MGEPWRLSEAFDLPDWIEISAIHRIRYETLDGQFRQLGMGGDQILAFRSTLKAELKWDHFGITGELSDSRQGLADGGTPLDTGIVNTWELLQGYGSLKFDGPFLINSDSELRIGRQTIDVGSRRLLARNRFRNTMNAFNGLHWQWRTSGSQSLQVFYLLPVRRRPFDFSPLVGNKTQFDKEGFDLQFWGVHGQKDLAYGATVEAYFFRLQENDGKNQQTRNRSLYTQGLRLVRKPSQGELDFDFESALQLGESRATLSPEDTTNLNHLAHLHHAELGYTIDMLGSPRLVAQYDYASGDRSPNDGEMNRFDTLFGARRFEHGPSGIYGAFARSNINSPGYRIILRPSQSLQTMFSHRLYWLASDADAWTTVGPRNPTGSSTSFVGNQIEAFIRWSVLPGNFQVEIGGARLFGGDFLRQVTLAGGQDDTSYAYVQLDFRF